VTTKKINIELDTEVDKAMEALAFKLDITKKAAFDRILRKGLGLPAKTAKSDLRSANERYEVSRMLGERS
jgi:hypothetical protein